MSAPVVFPEIVTAAVRTVPELRTEPAVNFESAAKVWVPVVVAIPAKVALPARTVLLAIVEPEPRLDALFRVEASWVTISAENLVPSRVWPVIQPASKIEVDSSTEPEAAVESMVVM